MELSKKPPSKCKTQRMLVPSKINVASLMGKKSFYFMKPLEPLEEPIIEDEEGSPRGVEMLRYPNSELALFSRNKQSSSEQASLRVLHHDDPENIEEDQAGEMIHGLIKQTTKTSF